MPTVAAMQRKFFSATKARISSSESGTDRLGDDQLGDVDGHVEDALDLDQRALGGVHDASVDDLGVDEVHLAADLERGGLGDRLRHRQEHGDRHDAVAGPLDLGRHEPGGACLGGLGEPHVDVVLGVELVDERHLVAVAQRAAAY